MEGWYIFGIYRMNDGDWEAQIGNHNDEWVFATATTKEIAEARGEAILAALKILEK